MPHDPTEATVTSQAVTAVIQAPDVAGVVEVVTARRIAGWAADRPPSERRLEVEIWSEGTMLGRTRAERPREDLVRSGIGDGCYGFELSWKDSLPPDRLGRIEVLVLAGPDGTARVPLPKRRADGTSPVAARAVPPPAWLAELATLCGSIERHAQRLHAASTSPPPAPNGRAITDDPAELRQLMAALVARLEEFDGLQPRLDALAAQLELVAHSSKRNRRPGHWLTWVVGLTACLALASLGTGLAGYLG